MINIVLSNFDLFQIANSGQCFRMNKSSDSSYTLIAQNRVLEIEKLGNSMFRFYCDEDDFSKIWYDYFDLGEDYSRFINSIDKNDSFLVKAADYGSGIRILKQDPWETLITFIISQRKNIPAIKKSVELLSKNYGTEIGDNLFSFPTPEKIASLNIDLLNQCSLGYRSPYVLKAAQTISNGEIDLHTLYSNDDDKLFETLTSFYGVGKKVANCIMLFAYHRIAAFPIDVWISRILEKEYNNSFDTTKYNGFAGVIQQYMFYYAQNSDDYKKAKQ